MASAAHSTNYSRLMKPVLTILVCFFVPTHVSDALKPKDIHGEWVTTTQHEPDEGITSLISEKRLFYKDGNYYAEGFGCIKLIEDDIRVWSLGGPEKATWVIKGDELHIKTTKIKLEFFSSSIEEMNREATDELLAEALKEPTIYTLVSQEKGKLVFKDKEDNSIITFTRRTKSSPKAPRWDKPLSSYPREQLGNSPVFKKEANTNPAGERFRRLSKMLLDHDGFKFSNGLPTYGQRDSVTRLRPKEEIAARILCNYLCWAYVYQTAEQLPAQAIKKYLELHKLNDKLTKQEKQILASDRKTAQKKFGSKIGWKLENTWALAWVLGFEECIDIDQGPFGEATAPALLKFMGSLAVNPNAFLKTCRIKSLAEVAQMEDIYYCTHNAVRSAQIGNADAVPPGFHAAKHGGIIHEKRHSLTWVLSPGVAWEDTDLDT